MTEETQAHYAINLTKLRTRNEGYVDELTARINEATAKGMSVKSVINPLETTGVIFGPFENARGAELMAASEINDEGKDFFGVRWGFICVKMTEIDFQKPLLERARVFVCTDDECKAVQRFKGSCSACKAKGKTLVPTQEVRDWEGVLQ